MTRPRKSHEVRFDETGGDLEVGFDEAAVELDRRSARRPAQIDMVQVVAREVILDPDRPEHPRVADEFLQFGALIGTMQPGRHEHGDVCRLHARIEQLAHDFGQ
jgi:hypothetical protein